VSYIAANYNTTVYQGETWSITFTFYTDAAETVPLNLSGYSASLVIGPPVNITLTPTLGGAAGTLSATLTAAQTSAQSAIAQPHYYVQLTDGSGDVSIPVRGTLVWSAP
jgi:hypothetical protein